MNTINTGDTAFMLICAALVLFMTPGLAFFYGGLVRSKNVVNTMMMSFAAMGIVAVQWVLWGYTIAFGPRDGALGGFVGGLQWLGLGGVGLEPYADYAPGIPHQLFMIYQAMFAIITPALISGAIVERMKFKAYFIFILLWSTIVYDLVAHWVWGMGGWLRMLGALDFAGGTVVHISAGVSALVATLVLGPRSDFPHRASPPHNVTLALLGGGMLWFGWFGFNAGSALGSSAIATAAFVATNTAAASGMLGWMLLEVFLKGKPTAVGAITGAVGGLVAITPACGFVTPVSAVVIGLGVAGVCYWVVNQRIKWGLDDTLDAFSVHGVGGIFGALMTGVLATRSVNPGGADGLLYGNPAQLLVQGAAVLATIVFAAGVTYILLKIIGATSGIRSNEEHQFEGLDVIEHGEKGYHQLEQ
jgi:ammonium transporter, Amt family